MNSFILELLAEESVIVDNTNLYSIKIYNKLSELIELKDKNNLRVSNIFGMFFEKEISVQKGKKYKVRIISKTKEVFSKIQNKLFEIAISKEKIQIEEGVFSLSGIITKNDTWCGEYNLEEELRNNDSDFNFYKELELKIVTPIIINRKSIYGFDNLFNIILENIRDKKILENIEGLKESIKNSIVVKKELYRMKNIKLLNNEIQKIVLGDIEIKLQGYYGKIFYNFINYIKYTGIGEYSQYGFGEIIINKK